MRILKALRAAALKAEALRLNLRAAGGRLVLKPRGDTPTFFVNVVILKQLFLRFGKRFHSKRFTAPRRGRAFHRDKQTDRHACARPKAPRRSHLLHAYIYYIVRVKRSGWRPSTKPTKRANPCSRERTAQSYFRKTPLFWAPRTCRHSAGIGIAVTKDPSKFKQGRDDRNELDRYAEMDEQKARDLIQVLVHHVSLAPTFMEGSTWW